MEKQAALPLTAIDQIANGSNLQMLKAVIPYTPYESQKLLAVYIKVMELENIITFYENSDSPMKACSMGNGSFNLTDMLNDIRIYSSPALREQLDSYMNIFSTMQMVETYQSMFSKSSGSEGNFNPMDMVKGMLSPEQQAMFEGFSTMFEADDNHDQQEESKEDGFNNTEEEWKEYEFHEPEDDRTNEIYDDDKESEDYYESE